MLLPNRETFLFKATKGTSFVFKRYREPLILKNGQRCSKQVVKTDVLYQKISNFADHTNDMVNLDTLSKGDQKVRYFFCAKISLFVT